MNVVPKATGKPHLMRQVGGLPMAWFSVEFSKKPAGTSVGVKFLRKMREFHAYVCSANLKVQPVQIRCNCWLVQCLEAGANPVGVACPGAFFEVPTATLSRYGWGEGRGEGPYAMSNPRRPDKPLKARARGRLDEKSVRFVTEIARRRNVGR